MTNFNFKLLDVVIFAGELINKLNRDIEEFKQYYISERDINELVEQRNITDRLMKEYFYIRLNIEDTYYKQSLRKALNNKLKIIMTMFEISFKQTDKKFWENIRIKDITTKKDILIYQECKSMIDYCKENSEKVNVSKIKISDIEDLETFVNSFWDAIDKKSTMQKKKKDMKEQLSIESKKLYSMVSNFCKIGKMIWSQNDSFTHYKEYLLYKNIRRNSSKAK